VPPTPESPLLRVEGLTKSFPGTRALREVGLTLHQGEALAVIGENGAGKSTLMKILAGVQRADAGTVYLEGREVTIDSVRAATELGIALIHQELNLADNLNVAANIFLGREPRRGPFLDTRTMRTGAQELLDRLGERFSPNAIVSSLPIGHQQMVEIAKALSLNARILIMDEPTSSLTQRETANLFRLMRGLKESGVSVIYISHRLAEVKELADRVVVLRDGENAGELAREEVCHERMVSLMVGREVDRSRHREPVPPGEALLEVRDLVSEAHPTASVSLSVRAGEVVGISGLVGAGRTELLETIFGTRRTLGGTVQVAGMPVPPNDPPAAIHAGIGLVPEDRKQQGVILEMAVRDNLNLVAQRGDHRVWVRPERQRRRSGDLTAQLRIKVSNDMRAAETLSGGNQQKVVLGKWLALHPKVLLLDEPTRGIDVGAKGEIYTLMDELAKSGVGILFVSSEMEEILALSDRVLVMHEGRIAGEIAHGEIDEERIMRLATGGAVAGAA
jgi:ribose transport system ATP-binding protein